MYSMQGRESLSFNYRCDVTRQVQQIYMLCLPYSIIIKDSMTVIYVLDDTTLEFTAQSKRNKEVNKVRFLK